MKMSSDWYTLAPDGVTPVQVDHYRWIPASGEGHYRRIVDHTRWKYGGIHAHKDHELVPGSMANGDPVFIEKKKPPHILVSTVFLQLDHGWHQDNDPVLWETMIFGGIHDGYQERYSSYKDARLGHEEAVLLARKGMTWRAQAVFMFERSRQAVAGGPRQLKYSLKRAGVSLQQRRWRMRSWYSALSRMPTGSHILSIRPRWSRKWRRRNG